MKRERDQVENAMTMADCLLLLSRSELHHHRHHLLHHEQPFNRVFECKTCNRQFSSFQALGGHRASHKKPRGTSSSDHHHDQGSSSSSSPSKPKTHECTVCGVEFAIGQALGGHMRRHRSSVLSSTDLSSSSSFSTSKLKPGFTKKKVNDHNIFCLDLNLTPSENDLYMRKFLQLEKNTVSMVDCFL